MTSNDNITRPSLRKATATEYYLIPIVYLFVITTTYQGKTAFSLSSSSKEKPVTEMYLWVIQLLFIPADEERPHQKPALLPLAPTRKLPAVVCIAHTRP